MAVAPPELLSLQVCERVVCDKMSGQFSVINILRTINAQGFPIFIQHVYIFAELVGGHGVVPLEIRIVDAAEERAPVFNSRAQTINFNDPLSVHQFFVVAIGVKFPAPGEYRVQVFSDGALLRQRRLLVRQQDVPGQKTVHAAD